MIPDEVYDKDRYRSPVVRVSKLKNDDAFLTHRKDISKIRLELNTDPAKGGS